MTTSWLRTHCAFSCFRLAQREHNNYSGKAQKQASDYNSSVYGKRNLILWNSPSIRIVFSYHYYFLFSPLQSLNQPNSVQKPLLLIQDSFEQISKPSSKLSIEYLQSPEEILELKESVFLKNGEVPRRAVVIKVKILHLQRVIRKTSFKTSQRTQWGLTNTNL